MDMPAPIGVILPLVKPGLPWAVARLHRQSGACRLQIPRGSSAFRAGPRGPNRVRGPGQPQHVPTAQTNATVRAMTAVGYSQARIAAHIDVSPHTLRHYYREILATAVEGMCARTLVNMVRIATLGRDHAAVQAGKYILSCKAGWKESSRIEIESNGRGLGAVLAIVKNAPAEEEEFLADDEVQMPAVGCH